MADTSVCTPSATEAAPTNRNANGKRRRGAQPGNRNAATHGFWTIHRVVKDAKKQLLSKRTPFGRAVAEWLAAVTKDLGGNLSQLQLDTVDRLQTTKMLLDTVDGILETLIRSPVNRRTRTLYPVVLQRNQLVETERKLRADLGLERRARELPSLDEYMKAHSSEPSAAQDAATGKVKVEATATTLEPASEAGST